MTWYMRVLVILGIVLGLGSASQAQMPDPQSQPPPAEVTRPETSSQSLTKSGKTCAIIFMIQPCATSTGPPSGKSTDPLRQQLRTRNARQ